VATDGIGREDPAGFAEPVVSLRMADGSEAHRPLRDVRARQVVAAVPWRGTRSARGQAHYPGCYWSATTSTHVIYESRLELARLLIADFSFRSGCARSAAGQPPWTSAARPG
jgi:hypothetical protein